jgi:hypothetical protein
MTEHDADGHPDGAERHRAQNAADDLTGPLHRHCAITVPSTTVVVASVTLDSRMQSGSCHIRYSTKRRDFTRFAPK